MSSADRDRGTRPGAAGPGFSGAALVYAQAYVIGFFYLHEPDIGPPRKIRVSLQRRSEPVYRGSIHRCDCHYRVGIAYGDGTDFYFTTCHRKRIYIRLAAGIEGQAGRSKVRYTHIQRHDAIFPDLRTDQPPGAIQDQFPGPGVLPVGEQAGDTSCAIAALLNFVAIGIKDTVINVATVLAWRFEDQDLIEANTGATVGKLFDRF